MFGHRTSDAKGYKVEIGCFGIRMLILMFGWFTNPTFIFPSWVHPIYHFGHLGWRFSQVLLEENTEAFILKWKMSQKVVFRVNTVPRQQAGCEALVELASGVLYIRWVVLYIQEPTELWKKKRFNLQAPPVYDRKVTNLFFPWLLFPFFFPYFCRWLYVHRFAICMHFKGEYWIIENMCLKIWYMPLKSSIDIHNIMWCSQFECILRGNIEL